MKRSNYVDLILIGTIVTIFVTSKSNERDVYQQKYASQEDCLQDWVEEENCTEHFRYSSGGSYLGPRYYWDRDIEKPVEVLEDGETRILNNTNISDNHPAGSNTTRVGAYSKGGFGSTGRGFTAGG